MKNHWTFVQNARKSCDNGLMKGTRKNERFSNIRKMRKVRRFRRAMGIRWRPLAVREMRGERRE